LISDFIDFVVDNLGFSGFPMNYSKRRSGFSMNCFVLNDLTKWKL